MPKNTSGFDYEFRKVVEFCQDNDLNRMLNWIEDRTDLPEKRDTLFRVYSQNYEGSKFISRRVLAKTKEEAALTHDRVWPDDIITHVEKIW